MKRYRGQIDICGIRYRVYTNCTVKDHALLEGDTEGCVDFLACKILLSAEVKNRARLTSNLVHEILHAIFTDSGAGEWLRAKTGDSKEDYEKTEEQIILLLSPYLANALRGIVKWPL